MNFFKKLRSKISIIFTNLCNLYTSTTPLSLFRKTHYLHINGPLLFHRMFDSFLIVCVYCIFGHTIMLQFRGFPFNALHINYNSLVKMCDKKAKIELLLISKKRLERLRLYASES